MTNVVAVLVAICVADQTFPPICYSPTQMVDAQKKCYADQGLVLHVAADPTNPDHVKQAAKDNALSSSPEIVCKNRAAYDAAIACSLKMSRDCTLAAYLGFLPSEDNLKQVQNIMCNNLNVLNHQCTVNNTDDLFACGQRKYGEMTVADAMDPYKATCGSYQHAEECLEEELQECGRATIDLQKQFNNLNMPVACQGDPGLGKRRVL